MTVQPLLYCRSNCISLLVSKINRAEKVHLVIVQNVKCVKVCSQANLNWWLKLHGLPHLLPGTANGLLPVRVSPCSEWLDEELEDLASFAVWERRSSKGFCLFQTTIGEEEAVPFLLRAERKSPLTACHLRPTTPPVQKLVVFGIP